MIYMYIGYKYDFTVDHFFENPKNEPGVRQI